MKGDDQGSFGGSRKCAQEQRSREDGESGPGFEQAGAELGIPCAYGQDTDEAPCSQEVEVRPPGDFRAAGQPPTDELASEEDPCRGQEGPQAECWSAVGGDVDAQGREGEGGQVQ